MKIKNLPTKFLLSVLTLGITGTVLNPTKAQAIVNFVGSDLITNDAWRTSSTLKSLDADGDNIYGTDGYTVFRSDQIGTNTATNDNIVQSPGYATVSVLPGLGYFSLTLYVDIDDPNQTGSNPVPNIDSGILTEDFVFGGTTEFFDITFTQAGNYRVGFLFDNANVPDVSPLDVTLAQIVGGSDSAFASLSSDRDLDADYYFFDIEASINDVYRLSGTGDPSRGSNSIGAVTFDTVPEPVPFELSPTLGLLMVGGIWGISRLRKSTSVS